MPWVIFTVLLTTLLQVAPHPGQHVGADAFRPFQQRIRILFCLPQMLDRHVILQGPSARGRQQHMARDTRPIQQHFQRGSCCPQVHLVHPFWNLRRITPKKPRSAEDSTFPKIPEDSSLKNGIFGKSGFFVTLKYFALLASAPQNGGAIILKMAEVSGQGMPRKFGTPLPGAPDGFCSN